MMLRMGPMNRYLSFNFNYGLAFLVVLIVIFLSLTQVILPCEPFEPVLLKPVDTSREDMDFFSFREKFEKAIKEKDSKFIEQVLDTNISFSFDANGTGKQKFLKYWKLDKNPKNSDFWKTMSDTIALGFTFKDQIWAAPFLFHQTPNNIDPYSYSLITGNTVNVRDQPTIKGKIRAQLSWEFVKNEYDETSNTQKTSPGEPCVWQKVCISDGTIGYICKQYLRDPLDYRVGFSKKDKKWMMIFFVEGGD